MAKGKSGLLLSELDGRLLSSRDVCTAVLHERLLVESAYREKDIRLTFPYPTRFPCQAGSVVRVDTTYTRSL
jgi:hypothetical protein